MQKKLAEKAKIRRNILLLREEQNLRQKSLKDNKIYKRLCLFPPFRASRAFFTYITHRGEVSTDRIMQDFWGKKKIFIPSVLGTRLVIHELRTPHAFVNGEFGIRESRHRVPQRGKNMFSVALIPGIAFDLTGHRIGFGKGFFDRFLKKINVTTIGLAYEFQIVDKLPTGPYDMAVDYIVTEKRIIRRKRFKSGS